MKNYERPTVIVNDDKSEGIYAASGCYEVKATMHQQVQDGRTDYRIQIDGKHNADHTNDYQLLTVTFDRPVTYRFSNGTLQGSASGNTISVSYNYHNNQKDNIGLGDLIVSCDTMPKIVSVSLTD